MRQTKAKLPQNYSYNVINCYKSCINYFQVNFGSPSLPTSRWFAFIFSNVSYFHLVIKIKNFL